MREPRLVTLCNLVARQQRKGKCILSVVAHIYANEAVFFSCTITKHALFPYDLPSVHPQ